MEKPRFKNKYLNDTIIEKGHCYTVKSKFETKLPHLSQRVVFALEISKEIASEFRDISSNLSFETTKKNNQPLTLIEGSVITTSADTYASIDRFLDFYVDTDESIGEFWAEFQAEHQENKSQNKQAMPKRRKFK